ncbi:head GIN domain-containing protein [uncultured Croceicoccus sp.]|uniref:head GIN domain-containing protein n=1 Tax=uncultured Croceicoccus sp. TaxID=1295329 RepID=UPI00261DBC51|nr:head GIN domain-containing protein [uncultured Croceicoccus sp.]
MRNSTAPLIMALIATTAACGDDTKTFSGRQGMPLSELELDVPAPDSLTLHGPDRVTVREGEKLAISVDGEPESSDDLRFSIADGTLVIVRKGTTDTPATVTVTMPAPSSVSMAGSGEVRVPALAEGGARITVAGSGTVTARQVKTAKLDVRIGGSGTFAGTGHARALNLDIAGSGAADMGKLTAEMASISITGSGTGQFRSDGTVTATIVGSGRVQVDGNPVCDINTLGSGAVLCAGS